MSSRGFERGARLEKAITAALPGEQEAYMFVPLLLIHNHNGKVYAVMCKSTAAAWQAGADAGARHYFHLEDMEGNRVTLETPHGQGHAHVIMEKLAERKEKS